MNTRFRSAFTLIEVLIVIAIIALLIGLLIPAVSRVQLSTKRTKAAHEIGQINTALRAYLDEYGAPFGNIANYANWPVDQKSVEALINGIGMEPGVVTMLGGKLVKDSLGKSYNVKRLPFFEVSSNSLNGAGQYIDPWGNPYKFMMDYNTDGKIEVNFTSFDGKTNLTSARVAVWSRGPDGSDKASDMGYKDDIRNW
ncbi:MAG: prepilin-type N-terminal cleavage/methylation domain-containing protein [Lentisphaerae bacterium]|nr:prepilin-type N-terminal cleavage/methylation domain-containing protein [Lentisphaerota bacterium]